MHPLLLLQAGPLAMAGKSQLVIERVARGIAQRSIFVDGADILRVVGQRVRAYPRAIAPNLAAVPMCGRIFGVGVQSLAEAIGAKRRIASSFGR
jgi:hypothetical protein